MKLNLPEFDIPMRCSTSGQMQVFDRCRRKYVALTPEEWVRQHFVNFLIEYREFPVSLIANEVSLRHNGNLRRCDTVIYNSSAHPLAIIEYKASTVTITESVFDQIVRYNMVMGVRWLMVSNGIRHYCCEVDLGHHTYRFLKEIPSYSQL